MGMASTDGLTNDIRLYKKVGMFNYIKYTMRGGALNCVRPVQLAYIDTVGEIMLFTLKVYHKLLIGLSS